MRQLFRSKWKITQEFGVNADYYKQYGLRAHEGIDLVPTGSVWDVLCLEDGIVVKDENNIKSGAYGNYVTIWHPVIKKATQYCHLQENYVASGDHVGKGQKIGLMGASGNTSGAHLHLNLFNVDELGYRLNKDNGYFGGIDPLPFLNEDTEPQNISQIEELKKLLEDEIKKKNENWQAAEEARKELDGAKEKIKAYEEFRDAIAGILNTESKLEIIRATVTELRTVEDKYRISTKELENFTSSFEMSTKNIDNLTSSNQQLRSKLQETEAALKIAQQTSEKNSITNSLQIMFHIGGIYVCRKTKAISNNQGGSTSSGYGY